MVHGYTGYFLWVTDENGIANENDLHLHSQGGMCHGGMRGSRIQGIQRKGVFSLSIYTVYIHTVFRGSTGSLLGYRLQ